jgi:hypothetical protein
MNRDELRQFIDFKAKNKNIERYELLNWIDNAENWQDELSCLTYLFAQILEKTAKDGEDCQKLIELFYQLPEQMYFSIQAFEPNFVEYMLRNTRNRSRSLEDDLVGLQNTMSEYQYGQTLRY